jgi:hypothetical protein
VEISYRVYRPRRPRESPLFRLVERHLEELLRVWPKRSLRQHGLLRAVVERVLRGFLCCGLLEHGVCAAVVRRVPAERARRILLSRPQLVPLVIPDPGQHRTLFYGEYASRVRGARQSTASDSDERPAEPARKRCSPSWARMIAKVYQWLDRFVI